MAPAPDISRHLADSPILGIKLEVGVHRDKVIERLNEAGIAVRPSPKCFKIIYTNFRGSLRALLDVVPALASYDIRQHRWWHRVSP
ncbi:MAG: hypothetical protein ACODAJ_14120 [Planctomycetota bacterium]